MLKITKINTRNEEGIALLRKEDIVAVVQQPTHFTKLYDANGNLVSETQDSPRFAIITNVGQTYIVNETEYQRLEKDLLD